MWRFRQPTAVPRPNSQGPATYVCLSLSLSGHAGVYEGQVEQDAGVGKSGNHCLNEPCFGASQDREGLLQKSQHLGANKPFDG